MNNKQLKIMAENVRKGIVTAVYSQSQDIGRIIISSGYVYICILKK